MFSWFKSITVLERKTFWGCFGGWALDALDAQVFSIAIPALIVAFNLEKSQVGSITSVTLITSALGGWIAGALSDRFGRVRVLQLTILWFSVFTFLSAFAQTFGQLMFLKACQGFGFGGEWAAGAVLMAEMIRPEHRGKALGLVQSAWAVGWGGSVLLYTVLFTWLPPSSAWRVMFAVGLLPALLIVYLRRSLPEPQAGRRDHPGAPALFKIFAPGLLRSTVLGALLGVGAHGGYYALMTWLPTFLKTERKLSVLGTGGYLAVIIVAFWCGCLASAFLLDRIGRRRNIIMFSLCCVATVLGYLFLPLTNGQMLWLGFPLGFFAAGVPASLGALFNELYPGGIRGTGVGFCYNFGRIASAAFPWLVGHMSESMSLGKAIGIDAAAAYALVVVAVLALPETKGIRLEVAAADPAGTPGGVRPEEVTPAPGAH
ncbi:MAG: permease of the major facilitator superfamily protein [Lacunisphaera sp.]|nr:permease of the major facilitator superfamily protein [Lacunisphaera sp.]